MEAFEDTMTQEVETRSPARPLAAPDCSRASTHDSTRASTQALTGHHKLRRTNTQARTRDQLYARTRTPACVKKRKGIVNTRARAHTDAQRKVCTNPPTSTHQPHPLHTHRFMPDGGRSGNGDVCRHRGSNLHSYSHVSSHPTTRARSEPGGTST